MRELPRLTRSLRSFSDLGRPNNFAPNDLITKRKEKADKLKKGHSHWKQFNQQVSKDVSLLLKQLYSIVSEICEGQTEEAINEMAFYILEILTKENVTSCQTLNKLKQDLGTNDPKFLNQITAVVSNIKKKLAEENESILEKLTEAKISQEHVSKPFGTKIPYKAANVIWPKTHQLHDMLTSLQNFNELTRAPEVDTVIKRTEYDKAQLIRGMKKAHEKYCTNMPYDQFAQSVIDKLKNSGDSIQAELFDFLGFENIELIEYLIEHRKHIISWNASQKLSRLFYTSNEQPQIASQVTVQSEREKQLLKQVRKEEKKLQKAASKHENKNVDEDEEDDFIDPNILKMQRDALKAMTTPILSSKLKFVTIPQQQEKYPFVFDTKLTAQTSAGFVSGQKILLPDNVTRTDSQLCEQVDIPVPILPPIEVGNDRILVSSLDEVGQIAFQGIESLNRIQSIVFEAAYNTNENLLICAPTGAGKTNVATLTIVHQLKLHIDNGVLQSQAFKIVYIAPMKALAAEMTANFNKRLGKLGVAVRELTGDMQLTKKEIQNTQMIVTTPEKWDVVTRKGTGDVALTKIVKLLIIDEVHLLHGDRGPVVEALVARTLRQVESSQSMIRIVGLSATLPNYVDVARFLRVNPHKGLFYFDHHFRPVPLSQTFIGVKAVKPQQQMHDMDKVCYNQVVDMVQKGHQVMVFVHARNATIRTATSIKELSLKNGTSKLFVSDAGSKLAQKAFSRSPNRHLSELLAHGMSVHHAGMLRADRNMVEKYFSEGLIKVLVCTSTLAWGVNLPAHAVIIRGTEIYDSKHGSYIDLGILDVLQIFGRAGRPQFDTSGHAVIITSHNKLAHYLSLLTNQFPIESSFISYLADNLNAEVVLGTICNVEEAVAWLSYTYLFVRMRLNHVAYGIDYHTYVDDPNLERKRKELITSAAKALDKAKMIRYHVPTGDLHSTDLGRIASYYYLKYDTIEIFNELMQPIMNEGEILGMICRSQEFEQLKVREEEMDELDDLMNENCELAVKGGKENIHGKVNILIQTYLSRGRIKGFSLISDQAYITQNTVRICRALFDMMLRNNNAIMAGRSLGLAKMLEAQQWDHMSPLRQFSSLPPEVIMKIEDRQLTLEHLQEMSVNEIANILRNQKYAGMVLQCCNEFPSLEMQVTLQPITRTVLRIRLQINPTFFWNDKVHGKVHESFWIWIEDVDNNYIYHHEQLLVTKKMVLSKTGHEIVMTIPLTEPLPSQYYIRATSDRWLCCEMVLPMTLKDLILPETHPPHTDLLELQPLPVTVLKNPEFEKVYKFTYFNPIQTQVFHCLYYTDNNVLLGAPTGSGKTVVAEIAMMKVFRDEPERKIVYIAPLKALVRERIRDWRKRLGEVLGKSVVELTGDSTPDFKAILNSDIIITTPEKWDGISRSWQSRSYVQKVALIIIDEIHLLGEDRGPVLEVIVSRTNFIASHTSQSLRIVGLSTALANALDLAQWLGIKEMGMYNFRPAVRPVPLEVHIAGFPGKHYCPRMATMNKPTFQAIRQHAPNSPVLIFVSSRRQTRLTSFDLINYLACEQDSKQWLHMADSEMDNILEGISDPNLKLTLDFGIGIHHAGLDDRDRRIVEELFVNCKIQVLVTTATLAWGVNFPAHLVVIKGTEYYDGKTKRYIDMPITDVLQMMGRAGRPQFDDSGVAVVLVHDIKKNFYKQFLYEPFPVESNLLEVLPDHINAEIVAGTIKSKQHFMDYLTWTYFFRRLMKNPKYYKLEALEPADVNNYLSTLVEETVNTLLLSRCIMVDEDEMSLISLPLGKVASYYYISHKTVVMFVENLRNSMTLEHCLKVMSNSFEYSELPVRHNEDFQNEELSEMCKFPADKLTYDSPHTKAFLLLQAHCSRIPLPSPDYFTDTKSVLDQAVRILQAMIDTAADQGLLSCTLRIMQLLQMIIQARWIDEPAVLTLPHIDRNHLHLFSNLPKCLPMFCSKNYHQLSKVLSKEFDDNQVKEIFAVSQHMPKLNVELLVHAEDAAENVEKIRVDLAQYAQNQCINMRADGKYIFEVTLERRNRTKDLRVHCPKFHRGKDEGWFLVLGDVKDKELAALKRASGVNGPKKNHPLRFTAPSKLGPSTITLFVMSDCYIGLDQQYSININVQP